VDFLTHTVDSVVHKKNKLHSFSNISNKSDAEYATDNDCDSPREALVRQVF